ncbi:hypothetical protein NQ317_006073 [Molorchus minor]|uniref:DUF4789 domain-containing protein n=1 Tax=Molorchus minor TaxID=1323400 RepID=A0ABQ9K3H1_9CUCU|nr:hypothetical protein NQ317_006073 [Molorchus minor]
MNSQSLVSHLLRNFFNFFQSWLIPVKLFLLLLQPETQGAVMAPPWADPKLNPCATQPRGWQLLFWPPDGKCYRIFKIGHPCPEGMELSPMTTKPDKQLSAECRCPPQTAQSARDGKCYGLFSLGNCAVGYYFGPDKQYKSANSKRQWGVCKQLKPCVSSSWIYWPKTERCYQKFTRGPCIKGQLLTVDQESKIPACRCDDREELNEYRHVNGQCYQHFTKGPCQEKGHLFLPDRTCGCHSFLPHFHENSQQCFELESIGPCAQGQTYQLHSETRRASCHCRPHYIPYQNATACYRPYTRGPCPLNHILINTTTCIEQPCQRGHLYFPAEDRCFRIGSRGPCPKDLVVSFDFNTRPSVDGVSYNGVCTCRNKDCDVESAVTVRCDRSKGLVRYSNECHKMYTQGPCPRGSWLVPGRQGKEELYTDSGGEERQAACECIPGYLRTVRTSEDKSVTVCLSPTVALAEYSGRNVTSVAQVLRVK